MGCLTGMKRNIKKPHGRLLFWKPIKNIVKNFNGKYPALMVEAVPRIHKLF